MELLKKAKQKGIDFDEKTVYEAIDSGDLEKIKIAIEPKKVQ